MAEPKDKLPQIAQSRLRQQAGAPVGPHPDANVLSAFVEQALGSEERELVLSHLAVCADCREIVALSLPEEDVSAPVTTASSVWNWEILRWGAVAAGVVVVAAAALLLNPPAILRNEPPASQVARLERQPERVEDKASPTETAPIASPGIQKPELSEKRQKPNRDETSRAYQGTANFIREPLVPSAKETKSNSPVVHEKPGVKAAPQLKDYAFVDSANGVVPAPARGAVIGGVPAPSPAAAPPPKSDKADMGSGMGGGAFKVPRPAPQVANANVEAKKAENAPTKPSTVQDLKLSSAQSSLDSLSADREKDLAKAENEKAESAAANRAVSAQTVEVTAEAPVVQTTSSMVSYKAKAPRAPWRINKEGKLLSRQPDGSWREVPFADNPKFRVLVAPKGTTEIWIGGAQGVLYHSTDNGTTWVPVQGGWPSEAEIVKLKFDDALNGTLRTSQKETWTTSNGGKNWQKQ